MCSTPVIKLIKHINLKNEWEIDLSALEVLELNDKLIQSTEDELKLDCANEFDASTLGSLEQEP